MFHVKHPEPCAGFHSPSTGCADWIQHQSTDSCTAYRQVSQIRSSLPSDYTLYLPMQKLENSRSSTSSTSTRPVISPERPRGQPDLLGGQFERPRPSQHFDRAG